MRQHVKRATNQHDSQQFLFPEDLDSKTEFWALWRFEEIVAIQNAMLIQSLNEIRDLRRSRAMRIEAWEWLFSNEDHPFSSRVCAENSGLDIESLRILLKRIVKDL
jgi:hypothetical protein